MAVPATTGQLRTKVSEMEIGDYIPFEAVSKTNASVPWEFSFTPRWAETAVTGRAFVDGGGFVGYLVKAAKGILICDRVAYHTMTWDALNAAKLIQGLPWADKNIIPTMTSNTSPSGVASASSVSSSNEPYKAFDGGYVTNHWRAANVGNSPEWIQYEFPEERSIKSMSIKSSNLTDDAGRTPREFKLLASKTGEFLGEEKTLLHVIGGGAFWISSEEKKWNFKNSESFIYYRILMLDKQDSASAYTLTRVTMSETAGIIRSLTGGVAFADANGNSSITTNVKGGFPQNNEWDKYIANYPIEKIQSGKTLNDVWNFGRGVRTWCQDSPTTRIGASTTRINRADVNNVIGLYANGSSISGAALGFRPVFEYKE